MYIPHVPSKGPHFRKPACLWDAGGPDARCPSHDAPEPKENKMTERIREWGFFGTLGRVAFALVMVAMALLCMHMEYEDLVAGAIH